MSPDGRVLEQNLAALLRRAYVPALPRPEFQRAVLELARDETLRRRGVRAPRLLRFALPAAAAAAAALALWLGLRPDAGAVPAPAPSAGELVARGAVALSFAGEPGWRAADAEELRAGLALSASGPAVEVHTPDALGLTARATDAQAALAPAGRARFAPLPDPAFGPAGPGCGAELRDGELALALGPGAATWWLATEAGLVRIAPDTALDARRAKGRTTVQLARGRAVLERPDGSELDLAAGIPVALARERFEDAGEGRGGRQEVETAAPRTLLQEVEAETAAPPADVPAPRAALAGRVRDAGGAPVTLFSVLLLREAEVPDVAEPIEQAFEAPDGAFEWRDLEPERYEVFVEAEGFAQHRTGVLALAAGEALELDVTLTAGRTLRGWVLDLATESPLAGAMVVVESEVPSQILPLDLSDQPDWLSRVGTAGADGGFVLEHLQPGPQRLRATAPGHAPEWLELDVPAEGPLPEVFARLAPGGGIAGVVVDGSGRPLAGSFLLASFAGAHLFSYKQTATDGEGRYAFDDLPPGFHMVIRWDSEAQAEAGAPPELRPILVARGKVSTLDFRADRSTLRLTGRFFDAAGAPLAKQKFTLLTPEANNLEAASDWQAGMTDGEGAYSVELSGPGTYLLLATYLMGEQLTLVDELQLEPGASELTRDVRFPATRVACTVLRSDGRRPVAGAGVVVLRLDERGEESFAGRAETDAQGVAVIEGLIPGRYLFAAGSLDAEDLAHAISAELELSSEKPEGALEVLLPAGGVLRVRVTDQAGAPVEGARLRLATPQGASVSTLVDPVITGSDGRFVVPGLAPATYTVSAAREGFAPATGSAEVRASLGGDLLLVLQPLD